MKKFLLKGAAWTILVSAIPAQVALDIAALPVVAGTCLFNKYLGWKDFKDITEIWVEAIPKAIVSMKELIKKI